MKKIVAPLVLLASVTLLTSSCTKNDDVPVVPPVTKESPVPVTNDTNPPAPPAPPVPTPSPEDISASGAPAAATVSPVTHTETVSYDSKSPEGMVQVEFSATVENGVITAASATPKAEAITSKGFQESFSKGVTAAVVGKNAKDLAVDAVGGASLTTSAFEMFAHSF